MIYYLETKNYNIYISLLNKYSESIEYSNKFKVDKRLSEKDFWQEMCHVFICYLCFLDDKNSDKTYISYTINPESQFASNRMYQQLSLKNFIKELEHRINDN